VKAPGFAKCAEAPSPTLVAADERWGLEVWGALLVLCGALFLDGLDVSMVGIALPSIRRDLGLSTTSLQWLVSGYVLGYGGFLLLGGRAADLLGRRRIFLIAVAVFALASLAGGLVSDGTLLILARFVKGASAAFTAPAGLSIITTSFPEGPARNRALSIYTTCAASGFSLGLVLSGLLTEVGWRWTFLLPVPVALAVLILGYRFVPRDLGQARTGGGYDVAGALAVTSAMLLLVYAVVQAPANGPALTVGAIALVAALLGAFLLIEVRSRSPLVRLGIFSLGTLTRANLAAVAFFGSYLGFQFVATLYLQRLAAWTPLETALAFLPAGLIVGLSSLRIGRLVGRYGATTLMVVGFIAMVLGYALFLRIAVVPDYVRVILPTMLLLGVGFALCFATLNIQATGGVADNEQGLAAGLLQTSAQTGGAIVLAVVTAVVTLFGGDTAQDGPALLGSYRPALTVAAVIAAIGLLVALTGLLTRKPDPNLEPA
jgi:MFS family permease